MDHTGLINRLRDVWSRVARRVLFGTVLLLLLLGVALAVMLGSTRQWMTILSDDLWTSTSSPMIVSGVVAWRYWTGRFPNEAGLTREDLLAAGYGTALAAVVGLELIGAILHRYLDGAVVGLAILLPWLVVALRERATRRTV